ncbi:MAG: GNAT family N-acetyltransferase [Bacteroidetes bacterium]|nr:GNAT family N-acetyltransferase [Bacteroidota bacterium]
MLELRPFDSNDCEFIIKLVNSKSWINYIGERNVKTKEEAEQYISKIEFKKQPKHPIGYLKIVNKTGVSIGIVGMLQRDYLKEPDLGFAFLEEFQGKGHAFEAVASFLNYYLELEKSILRIAAIVHLENVRSIRLLDRLGFKYDQKLINPIENLVLYYYSRK